MSTAGKLMRGKCTIQGEDDNKANPKEERNLHRGNWERI